MITQTLDRHDDVLGHSHGLAEHLAQRLERLYVLQLWSGEHQLPPNVRVRSMGKERGVRRSQQLATLTSTVRTLAERHEVDLVFAHMAPLYAIAATPIAHLSRIPVVFWYAHRQVSPLLRLATALVDRVVSPTAESFRLTTRKLTLVGHGIDTHRFTPRPLPSLPGSLAVLSAGRISPIKRLEVLVRAARLVADRAPELDVRFTILGGPGGSRDVQYLSELNEQARTLRLDQRLEFAAAVPYPRIPEAIATHDLHVNLAPTGAPDKAVLEAMAMARVSLACNRTFATLFGADLDRCLFTEGDDAGLAERILGWARTDAEERMRVGMRLRDGVERDYSMNGLADRLIRVFQEVAATESIRAAS